MMSVPRNPDGGYEVPRPRPQYDKLAYDQLMALSEDVARMKRLVEFSQWGRDAEAGIRDRFHVTTSRQRACSMVSNFFKLTPIVKGNFFREV